MLALTYRGKGRVRVQEKREPKLEHPNDVILEVTRTAICGSDLHLFQGPPYNLVNMGAAMNKGLTLRMGQCNVKRYMPHLLEHIRAGRIDAEAIITHRFRLDEAEEAYRVFEQKTDGCIKCVLIPPNAA